MSIVPPDRFAAVFARLNATERAAFVGAMWETKGRTVERDGTLVVLDGDTRVTFEPNPQQPRDAVDLVVVPEPSARLCDATGRTGATIISAGDIRALLLYGIERGAAECLYQAHIGRPLSADHRARRRFRDRLTARSVLGALSMLVVIALVVITLPLGVGPGFTSERATDSAERFDASGSTLETSGSETILPPGVETDGTIDVHRLSAAHADALRGTAFTMHTQYDGPPSGTSYESAAAFETTLYVETHSLFRFKRAATADSGEARTIALYADGCREFFRYEDDEGVREGSSPVGGQSNIPLYVGDSRLALQRFLTATETRVEQISEEGRVRVHANGSPERLDGNVSDYRAEAVVRSDGLVSSLTVEYVDEDASTTVTFRQEFDAVGTTAVSEPDWYTDHPDVEICQQTSIKHDARARGINVDT